MNEKVEYVKISKTELKNLLYANEKLSILENNGVDNWIGYMDNYQTYLSNALGVSLEYIDDNNIQLEDLIEQEIKTYEVI